MNIVSYNLLVLEGQKAYVVPNARSIRERALDGRSVDYPGERANSTVCKGGACAGNILSQGEGRKRGQNRIDRDSSSSRRNHVWFNMRCREDIEVT